MIPSTSKYLLLTGNIARTRVIGQIRLAGDLKVNFFLNKIGYTWNSEEQCSICNLHENEDLHHFLIRCPHYKALREHYLKKWTQLDRQCPTKIIVDNPTRSDINNIYFYVQAALKLRAFLRNE